jgi:nucleoside 2-deoxyribosyltransferase
MFAFVLMPFDAEFNDIYNLGIKEPAAKLGITAERVDDQIFHKENILERIYNQISAADFVIADMTGRNPNVFYETGYAHAKSKTCLLITSDADDIPFDLKHHRHVIYGSSIQNLRRSIEAELMAIKAEVMNRRSVITVQHKVDGTLVKNAISVKADIELIYDLHNKTSTPSAEIEAVYLYTGQGWEFTQDGQPCVSTEADEGDYITRHFLKVPVRRLQSTGWVQIKLTGSKYLAWETKEKQKDKYRLAGRSLLRIMTAEATHDYPINLDFEVEEFPF